MIVYLDTSALLRLVLGEPGALAELTSARSLVSSELLDEGRLEQLRAGLRRAFATE